MALAFTWACALILGTATGSTASSDTDSARDERPSVAVMNVKAVQGVATGTVEILANIIAADLATHGFNVIARSDIMAMMDFQQDQMVLGCTDASCIAELGGALGVRYVLTGQVGQIGSQFNITLIVVESARAKVAARVSMMCDASEDALVEAAHDAVAKITQETRTPAPPPPVTVSQPLTRRRSLAWTVLGTSAALLAAGGAAGLVARSRYSDLEAQRDAVDYVDIYQREESGIRHLNWAADALFGGGAVAAALGTWLWFRSRGELALAPVVSYRTVAIVGSF